MGSNRARPVRAARWAAVVTALVVVGTLVVPMIPTGGSGRDDVHVEATLGLPFDEVALAVAGIPVLFGLSFLVAMYVLRRRTG